MAGTAREHHAARMRHAGGGQGGGPLHGTLPCNGKGQGHSHGSDAFVCALCSISEARAVSQACTVPMPTAGLDVAHGSWLRFQHCRGLPVPLHCLPGWTPLGAAPAVVAVATAAAAPDGPAAAAAAPARGEAAAHAPPCNAGMPSNTQHAAVRPSGHASGHQALDVVA